MFITQLVGEYHHPVMPVVYVSLGRDDVYRAYIGRDAVSPWLEYTTKGAMVTHLLCAGFKPVPVERN